MGRRELCLQSAIFSCQAGCLLEVVHAEEVSCCLVFVTIAAAVIYIIASRCQSCALLRKRTM